MKVCLLLLPAMLLVGCSGKSANVATDVMAPIRLDDPMHPRRLDAPQALAAGRNEWVGFAIELKRWPDPPRDRVPVLRVRSVSDSAKYSLPASSVRVSQVLPIPIEPRQAAIVRLVGPIPGPAAVPHVLLDLPERDGNYNLNALRDPTQPANPDLRAKSGDSGPRPILWVDVYVPTDAPVGKMRLTLETASAFDAKPDGAMAMDLEVRNLALPFRRNLQWISPLSWDTLQRLYPQAFRGLAGRTLNRGDDRSADAMRTIDALVAEAQRHRVTLSIPEIQPTVKWERSPVPPRVDWEAYSSVIEPWLTGQVFDDRTPLAGLPVPLDPFFSQYDTASQSDYLRQAAGFLETAGWLSSMLLYPDAMRLNEGNRRVDPASAAAKALASHASMRVLAEMPPDAVGADSSLEEAVTVQPNGLSRLLTFAPGPVSPVPNAFAASPSVRGRWLASAADARVPGGGGRLVDARSWAMLAWLQGASVVMLSEPLPGRPSGGPVDPGAGVLIYPGEMFKTDKPLPTLQLKFLRQAEQEYEYMLLAVERGSLTAAKVLAQLLTRPVGVPAEAASGVGFDLLWGVADDAAWDTAMGLLARGVMLRPATGSGPARKSDFDAVELETRRWQGPRRNPVILPRSVQWRWDETAAGSEQNRLRADVTLDLYNPSDEPVGQNRLESIPPSQPTPWNDLAKTLSLSDLAAQQVTSVEVPLQVSLDRIVEGGDASPSIRLTSGDLGFSTDLPMWLPVAVCDRREGVLTPPDGNLDDWRSTDAIHSGPLTRMMDRPSLQTQARTEASTPSTIYTGYTDAAVHLGWRVEGLSPVSTPGGRNFVLYQRDRMWGEDLVQATIQATYSDNRLGPVLSIVFKPGGAQWVQRRAADRIGTDAWVELEGLAIRYAPSLAEGVWRGEATIPWAAIGDPTLGRPQLLRFNFAQHRMSDGETATWAGPVDTARDARWMGLLYVRDLNPPGMHNR